MTTLSWGELRPARVNEWHEADDGRVSIHVPRFGRGRLGKRLQRWLAPRPYQVHLDELGTFVWRRCDGETPVRAIADAMQTELGETAEPVEDRLVLFLQHLLRGRFISLEGGHSTFASA